MKLTLEVWRQKDSRSPGAFETIEAPLAILVGASVYEGAENKLED